jgi:hypothetical protein
LLPLRADQGEWIMSSKSLFFRVPLEVVLTACFAVAVATVTHPATAAVAAMTAPDGTKRRIEAPADNQVNLYMGDEAQPFKTKYVQTDPSYQYGSGPVAIRNLMFWYGIDTAGTALWTTLATETKNNHAAEDIDTAVGCAVPCGPEPVCIAACVAIVHERGNKGCRPSALVNTLQKHAPPGYKAFFQAHNNSPDRLLEPLRDGNPVIVLINTGHYENKWVVVTGIYSDSGGLKVRLANNTDMTWASFVQAWGLAGFSDKNIERSFMDEVVGNKPYFWAYYSKATDRVLGKFCMDHNECRSRRCDNRPDAGCVAQDGHAGGGEFCTTHQQCATGLCNVTNGVRGTCVVELAINQAEPGFTYCAQHGKPCTVPNNYNATTYVAYGAGGRFIYSMVGRLPPQYATLNVTCGQVPFDPYGNVVKACYVTSSPPLSGLGYAKCANEGQQCSFSGTKLVAYGDRGVYGYRVATGGIACANGVFGDPLPGIVKYCYVKTPSEVPGATFCSLEGQRCNFGGTKTVVYGVAGKFRTRTATGGIDCNNGLFGDPYPNVPKYCYIK